MQSLAQRGDTQHASTVGDDGLVATPGAGVEHFDLGREIQSQATDRIALAVLGRVAAGGHHDTDRRARIPVQLDLSQAAVERGQQHLGQIRAQPHQDRLGFRVTEANVEFQHPGAGRGDHQAGVEKATERTAIGDHACRSRPDHIVDHTTLQFLGDHRRR